MPKPILQIVTANRLADGRVVFLAPSGWSRAIDAALALESTEAVEAALARAERDAAANHVVDVYAIDVRRAGPRIVPARLRERIRVTGPTAGNSTTAPRDKAA